jgi:phosphoribosyl-ATP pyrophosphohydrolase
MEESKGLVIRASGWTIIDVVAADEKAYTKSLESGVLWHKLENGRVLPYELPKSYRDTSAVTKDGVKYAELEDNGSFYEAEIAVETRKPQEKKSAPAQDDFDAIAMESATMSGAHWGKVMEMLVRVVDQRKQELPEGSYTTHLFQSGGEKIRKKTAEEATELVLAQGRDRVTYEAADLVYHLLVLLASEEIPFDDVIKELEERMIKG